jgi:hypothetical protein
MISTTSLEVIVGHVYLKELTKSLHNFPAAVKRWAVKNAKKWHDE